MRRHLTRAATGLLALTLLWVLIPASPSFAGLDVTQWKWARRISPGQPGWTVVELDGPALAGARRDLADLRVVDAAKRELPWKELPRAAGRPERFTVRLFDLVTDEAAGRTSFVVDVGRAGLITNGIVLETTSRDFFKALTFEVSNDLETWFRHVGREYEYIYDLSAKGGGACLTASYPDTSYRYIRVTMNDLGTPPLEQLSAELVRLAPPAVEERPVPAQILAQGLEGGNAWAVLDLGYGGIPVTRVGLTTSAAYFQRAVTVEGSDDRAVWTDVARGAIYRLGPESAAAPSGPGTGGAEQLSLALPESTYRFYRVTVVSGEDPPVTPESIQLSGPPRRILFKRTGPEQLFLLYGNPEAPAPRYDPAQFTEPGAANPVAATLGRELTVLTEPEEAEPAQPVASDADPDLWRFERPVDVSEAFADGGPEGEAGGGQANGFVAVTLDQAVVGAARWDYGDLRLVDDAGSDVPFLVRTDSSVPATAWPFKIASAGTEKDTAWWVLDLGAPNTPSQLVRVETTGRNLTRTVTITGSNDGEVWHSVARGVVRRVDTIFGLEENLVVSYPVARYRYLRVEIPEGSGFFKPAEVKGFPPAIVFRPQEGRQYRLFYGNQAAPARVYPAALFVDAYAPLRLGPEALGPVTDHNPPPGRPSFLAPGTGAQATGPASAWVRWGLWAVLAVGVVGIGLIVVRVFRAVVGREKDGKETQR